MRIEVPPGLPTPKIPIGQTVSRGTVIGFYWLSEAMCDAFNYQHHGWDYAVVSLPGWGEVHSDDPIDEPDIFFIPEHTLLEELQS